MEPVKATDNIFGNAPATEAGTLAPETQKVLRNTYLLLAMTMVPTLAGAWLGMKTGSIIMASPIMSVIVMLGALFGLQYAISHFRDSVIGIGLLLLMTGLLGWWMGPMLNHAMALKNGAQLVGYAAAGTGAVFFAMGTIVSVTKRDFSFMGKFLVAGMIALIAAGIANMFLQIPALGLALSTLGIVVFSLFLLFDLSRITSGEETNYVMATTGIYLSLLNIFMNLLSLLMNLGGEKD